jgi:hypothetical protein
MRDGGGTSQTGQHERTPPFRVLDVNQLRVHLEHLFNLLQLV